MSTFTQISFNSYCLDFNGKPVYVNNLYKMDYRLFAFTVNGWFTVIKDDEHNEYKILPLLYADDEYALNCALHDLDNKEFLTEQEIKASGQGTSFNLTVVIILAILIFLSLM